MDFSFSDPGEKLRAAGKHRICVARQTIERIRPLQNSLGITRLANVTGLDRIGIPVALAIRPNSRSVAVSQGKGMTLDDAKASALMESTEIWHAEHFDRPLYHASAYELDGRRRLIDLDRLPRISGSVFKDSLRMLWAQGYDLMDGQEILVPFEMVHADYTNPAQPGHGCFPASTNGLASGNHPLEAICHGICEVIERDALAVWDAAQQNCEYSRRLSLASVDNEGCQRLLRRLDDARLDSAVWDITSDIGVATFIAVIREKDGSTGHLGFGSGSHPDRVVALRRALTEAAQTRLNYITGSRDDLSAEEYSVEGMTAKVRSFGSLFLESSDKRLFGDVPTRVNETLKADLNWLLDRLRAVGIEEVAVVDLTWEEFSIPVVRVVVPGLEAPHDDATYIPGERAKRAVAPCA